jgi:diguanylate cyclase (GGDEF)-like protein
MFTKGTRCYRVFSASWSNVRAFLIWSGLTSMARGTEGKARLERGEGALTDRLGERVRATASFTPMASRAERQADERHDSSRRLEGAHQELEAKAGPEQGEFTDELTKLYNRRCMSARLEQEVARYHSLGRPFSVVVLEVEALALIDDELGQEAGDETRRTIAELLRNNSRAVDVISRSGGDEFAILLRGTSSTQVSAYVARIRRLVSLCSLSHGRKLAASFGTASFPDDAAAVDDLLRGAEQSLHDAPRDVRKL